MSLLQQKLGIRADGIFGAQTEAAVIAYQKGHGCTPDGIVGPHTWEELGFPQAGGRAIDEIILHCSASREGTEVKSSAIDAMHKARKFSSYVKGGKTQYIGYHYLVHLDGSVEECRPTAKAGCHASGHNARSIGICYIGGLDSKGDIKDTRTTAQKAAIGKLIRDLKAKHPSIKKVIGHRDTSPDLNGDGVISPYEWIKGCPCFEASEYAGLVK